MKLSVGGLTFVITNKLVTEEVHAVIVDRPFKVKRPVLVDQLVEVKIPVIKRVPVEIEVPEYHLKAVEHQVVVHRYHPIEKPYDVEVEHPVVREVQTKVEVERLIPVDKVVEVPRYKVVYTAAEDVPATLSQTVIADVKCQCGITYKSNWTKCTHCGRTTIENLKDMSK